jgi:hypothetical protein
MAALAPPGCLRQPLFPRAADRCWYCVEISLSDVPAARRGPRMRQGRGGDPVASKKTRQQPPLAQHRPEGAASERLKLVSASRAQSFYSQGSSHLGSLPRRHLNRLQVDQRAELGPFLADRDQQFVEADVVHLAADVASEAHRR